MIFIDNKYTRWYYIIIENAKNNSYNGYTELHHIVPKSYYKRFSKTGWLQGNPNSSENLVRLTAREHFICHVLLTKMTDGIAYQKSIFAVNRLCKRKSGVPKYKISSRVYETLKKQWNEINPFKNLNWQKENGQRAKGRKFTKEHCDNLRASWTVARKENISKQNKGISRNITTNRGKKMPQLTGVNNGFYGKTHSNDFKEQQRIRLLNKPAPWANQKKTCPHCQRELDLGNYKRYHGDKCKLQN